MGLPNKDGLRSPGRNGHIASHIVDVVARFSSLYSNKILLKLMYMVRQSTIRQGTSRSATAADLQVKAVGVT